MPELRLHRLCCAVTLDLHARNGPLEVDGQRMDLIRQHQAQSERTWLLDREQT